MKKFIIEKDFWELFPDARIAVIILNDANNNLKLTTDYFNNLLHNAIVDSRKHTTETIFSENAIVKKWRMAYQKFKTKKGARSSIEALLKRASNNGFIKSINPMVDLYNAISLKFGIPCGGEDIDKIVGDMLLTKAKGNEKFCALGSEENETPLSGELIYKDNEGAICRCLNWRESIRTMLTPTTTNAVFVLEEIEKDVNVIDNAANDLKLLFKQIFKVEPKLAILDITHSEIELNNK